MRARHFISITFALLVAAGTAHAAAIVWHSLGTTSVKATPADAKTAQPDEIRLMSASGPYTRIRLGVEGGTVTIDRLVVTFAHGSTQSVDLHKTFQSGNLTHEIRLTGNDHVVRKVAFWYRAPKFATIRLYAN